MENEMKDALTAAITRILYNNHLAAEAITANNPAEAERFTSNVKSMLTGLYDAIQTSDPDYIDFGKGWK